MPTLKEVAEKAGVSITTVSRVINNSDKVTSETRERVQEAMRALEYSPNRVAQRLRGTKGQSKLLGLIIPDIQNQFYSNIVRGVEDVAYGNNYALILCNSDEDPNKQQFYLEVLRSESVDGIILPPIEHLGVTTKDLLEYNMPIVCFDRKFEGKSVDTVVVDNFKGAYTAVSHLIKLGHERIAIISSSLQFSSFQERQEGYEQALKDHNIEIDERLIKKGDPRSSESGRNLTKELLEITPRPTAIFVSNNLMTLGALGTINELNLDIPDDISIIMYDDMLWATAIKPPLTVVKQPSYEMGRKAVELFFQRIANSQGEPTQVVLEPELIVRKSTAAINI